jgi:hypothetical protein
VNSNAIPKTTKSTSKPKKVVQQSLPKQFKPRPNNIGSGKKSSSTKKVSAHKVQINDKHDSHGGSATGGNGGHAEGGAADCSTSGSLIGVNALNFNSCNGGAGGEANGGIATGGRGGDSLNSLLSRDGAAHVDANSATAQLSQRDGAAHIDAQSATAQFQQRDVAAAAKPEGIVASADDVETNVRRGVAHIAVVPASQAKLLPARRDINAATTPEGIQTFAATHEPAAPAAPAAPEAPEAPATPAAPGQAMPKRDLDATASQQQVQAALSHAERGLPEATIPTDFNAKAAELAAGAPAAAKVPSAKAPAAPKAPAAAKLPAAAKAPAAPKVPVDAPAAAKAPAAPAVPASTTPFGSMLRRALTAATSPSSVQAQASKFNPRGTTDYAVPADEAVSHSVLVQRDVDATAAPESVDAVLSRRAKGGNAKSGNGGSANGGKSDSSITDSLIAVNALNFGSNNGGTGGLANSGKAAGGRAGKFVNKAETHHAKLSTAKKLTGRDSDASADPSEFQDEDGEDLDERDVLVEYVPASLPTERDVLVEYVPASIPTERDVLVEYVPAGLPTRDLNIEYVPASIPTERDVDVVYGAAAPEAPAAPAAPATSDVHQRATNVAYDAQQQQLQAVNSATDSAAEVQRRSSNSAQIHAGKADHGRVTVANAGNGGDATSGNGGQANGHSNSHSNNHGSAHADSSRASGSSSQQRAKSFATKASSAKPLTAAVASEHNLVEIDLEMLSQLLTTDQWDFLSSSRKTYHKAQSHAVKFNKLAGGNNKSSLGSGLGRGNSGGGNGGSANSGNATGGRGGDAIVNEH